MSCVRALRRTYHVAHVCNNSVKRDAVLTEFSFTCIYTHLRVCPRSGGGAVRGAAGGVRCPLSAEKRNVCNAVPRHSSHVRVHGSRATPPAPAFAAPATRIRLPSDPRRPGPGSSASPPPPSPTPPLLRHRGSPRRAQHNLPSRGVASARGHCVRATPDVHLRPPGSLMRQRELGHVGMASHAADQP